MGVAPDLARSGRIASRMERSVMGSLLLLAMGCAVGMADIGAEAAHGRSLNITGPSPGGASADGSPRPSRVCGRNGLFMLCRLLGHDVPFARIEQSVPVGSAGSSLLDLRDAARTLGVPLTVYRCEPNRREVVRLPPCMALIRSRSAGNAGAGTALQGHYVLVERVDQAGDRSLVELIDGSYGLRQSLSAEEFASIWTGYFLARSNLSLAPWPRRALLAGLISLLAFSLSLLRRRHARPSVRQTRPEGPFVLLASPAVLLILAGSCGAALGGENGGRVSNRYDLRDGSWRPWRIPERDAVNALYILMRCLNRGCNLHDVREALGAEDRRRNLLQLRDSAHILGVAASVYRCSPATLASLEVPVIAHLEGVGADPGGFCVVLPTRDRSGLTVIDADTAQIFSVKEDDFLHAWDGTVLVPEEPGLSYYWLVPACLLAAVIVAYRGCRLA